MKRIVTSKEQSRGVFWVIDDELLAYPYYEGDTIGVSKSGDTFNHKKLWNGLKPRGSKHGYNYYPRGRVDFSNRGKPLVYMNPNIDEDIIPQIENEFGLREEPTIMWDYSNHYKCHIDDGFKEEFK